MEGLKPDGAPVHCTRPADEGEMFAVGAQKGLDGVVGDLGVVVHDRQGRVVCENRVIGVDVDDGGFAEELFSRADVGRTLDEAAFGTPEGENLRD